MTKLSNDEKEKIREMSKYIYENSNYSKSMSDEIARFNVLHNYKQVPKDYIIIKETELWIKESQKYLEGMLDGQKAEAERNIWKPAQIQLPKEITDQIVNKVVNDILQLLESKKVPEDGRHEWRDYRNESIEKMQESIKEKYNVI
jgi:hypothetical protein